MPLLNPGIIVASSPMLSDEFSVRRSVESVNTSGRRRNSDTVIPNLRGVISQPKKATKRGESRTQATSTYSVITRFRLRGESKVPPNAWAPDVVLFKGMELMVIDVQDYAPFGVGWVEATCTSNKVVQPPTGTGTPV